MMKKILLIFTVAFSALSGAFAQTLADGVIIRELNFRKTENELAIAFLADVSRRAVRSDYTLTVVPVLSNGTDRIELSPIVVQGRRARISAERRSRSPRHSARCGYNTLAEGSVITRNGVFVDYSTTVHYQPWMEGSSLTLEKFKSGCCSSRELNTVLLASDLVIVPPVIVEPKPEPVPEPKPEPVFTTGDKLAMKHKFVALATADGRDLEQLVNANREGSVTIFFRQGKYAIDREFRDNGYRIDEIISVMREIMNSSDSKVVRIVIAGFASPEGPLAVNERLGLNRATALKEYIVRNTPVSGSIIDIYNGAVDWHGLRELVADSDIREKQQILDIIDNTPVWDSSRQLGRRGELMRLSGGNPYRYMYHNFFPLLRNAAYIKVYYENK